MTSQGSRLGSFTRTLVRVLLVSTALTVVIDLFFVPNYASPPLVLLATVFGTQVVSILAATSILRNVLHGFLAVKFSSPIRTVIVAFLFSLWIVFILQPLNNIGLLWTFVSIMIIEIFAYGAVEAMIRFDKK
ncbi:MAG TPA: hypothetical protein VGS11_10845 [Candidatus Bathyarchaeia archaeon]|nr:hypothetical protein [Candidatus Bathyarchaeia archaeon]